MGDSRKLIVEAVKKLSFYVCKSFRKGPFYNTGSSISILIRTKPVVDQTIFGTCLLSEVIS
jgi:hypothetical protein